MPSANLLSAPIDNRRESCVASAPIPVAVSEQSASTSLPREKSVLNASAWSMVGYGCNQVLRLGNNMVLSYLLVPEAFGTMAIINMVIVGLGMFSEVGAGPCIIQNSNGDRHSFLNTAWSIQSLRGAVISICACILAWPVSNFYQQPSLQFLIPVAALTSLINGLCSTSVFTLQRHMDLKSLAWLDIRAQLAGSVCMCLIAWFYPSVWALVLGAIMTSLIRTLLSHRLVAEYQSRYEWNKQYATELFRFGKWIFVSTLLAFGAMQVDRMMLGKLFDVRTLGVYSFALAIAMMPRMLIEKLCMSILYPLLARCQRDSVTEMPDRLQSAREVILVVGLAMVASVFLWCDLFFKTLYHADYHSAGYICQLLCATTWIVMLSITLSRALIALGNTRALALFNFMRLSGSVLASMLGLRLAGFDGFVVGLAAGAAVGHAAIVFSLARHGIQLLGQDLRLTFALAMVATIAIGLHQNQQVGLPAILTANVFICGILWMWAAHEVRLYRSREINDAATRFES